MTLYRASPRCSWCVPTRTTSDAPWLWPDHTGGHHGSTVRLISYELPTTTPELTEHLLDDKLQQRAHCLGEREHPFFWRRRKSSDDDSPSGGHVVNWASVRETCKDWLTNPMNIALVLWLLCVGVSGGMFVLLLLGLLEGAFPAAADRNRWIEINNQVLNALFTLMSLYQHPSLCHHLFLLCRWRPADAAHLRADYCKDGADAAPRRDDRAHIAVVVALLHLTVMCQYVLCGLYWGFTRTTRPELAEGGFFALGIVAPVAAAVYTVCSPLGKGDRCHELSEAAAATTKSTTQPTTTHVGGAGVLLYVDGLLYGGYWRIQMRRRFGLPGSTACCGSESLTDYARWLFCWPCALAQEVRTASMYYVDGEVFYSKVFVVDEDDHAGSGQPPLLAVSNDRDVFRATDTVALTQASPANDCVVVVYDETTMAPPVQVVVVQVEDECKAIHMITNRYKLPFNGYSMNTIYI